MCPTRAQTTIIRSTSSEAGGSASGSSSSKRMLSWLELGIWCITGVGLISVYLYLNKTKEWKLEEKSKDAEVEQKRRISQAIVGGPLTGLVDHNGNVVKEDTFAGKWIMIYFGFCHCPDICPDKLDTVTDAVNEINAMKDVPNIQPLFITVDPRRDTVENIRRYLHDFHPDFIGLTGDEEHLKRISKDYHVYSKAGEPDEDNDYIVDHTVILYLMDPDGKFSDYYGRAKTLEDVISGVRMKMDMRLGRI